MAARGVNIMTVLAFVVVAVVDLLTGGRDRTIEAELDDWATPTTISR